MNLSENLALESVKSFLSYLAEEAAMISTAGIKSDRGIGNKQVGAGDPVTNSSAGASPSAGADQDALNAFLAAWGSDDPEMLAQFDSNNDGQIDGADLTAFLSRMGGDASPAETAAATPISPDTSAIQSILKKRKA